MALTTICWSWVIFLQVQNLWIWSVSSLLCVIANIAHGSTVCMLAGIGWLNLVPSRVSWLFPPVDHPDQFSKPTPPCALYGGGAECISPCSASYHALQELLHTLKRYTPKAASAILRVTTASPFDFFRRLMSSAVILTCKSFLSCHSNCDTSTVVCIRPDFMAHCVKSKLTANWSVCHARIVSGMLAGEVILDWVTTHWPLSQAVLPPNSISTNLPRRRGEHRE